MTYLNIQLQHTAQQLPGLVHIILAGRCDGRRCHTSLRRTCVDVLTPAPCTSRWDDGVIHNRTVLHSLLRIRKAP
jgi:hypothetical protein